MYRCPRDSSRVLSGLGKSLTREWRVVETDVVRLQETGQPSPLVYQLQKRTVMSTNSLYVYKNKDGTIAMSLRRKDSMTLRDVTLQHYETSCL